MSRSEVEPVGRCRGGNPKAGGRTTRAEIPPTGDTARGRHDWAIILAGGEGRRLWSLTTSAAGVPTPKQFCSFGGEKSLVAMAVERAERIVPRDRILAVVAEDHRPWWEDELSALPAENILVQPQDRGTATGILLPLLVIQLRDVDARALVFPSDHFVAREWTLATALLQALRSVSRSPRRIVLIGMAAEQVETGLGWIVAGTGPRVEPRRVIDFVEKPDLEELERLMARGSLVNSLILASRAQFLLALMSMALPGLVGPFLGFLEAGSDLSSPKELGALYESLPNVDFSRDLLESLAGGPELFVLQVPACGWSDLGTPERVRSCRVRYLPAAGASRLRSSGAPDLAAESLVRWG